MNNELMHALRSDPHRYGFHDWPFASSIPDIGPNDTVAAETTSILKMMLTAEERGDIIWDDWNNKWRAVIPRVLRIRPRYGIPAISTEALLAKLERVRRSGTGWTARCPSHPDKSPSLSIQRGNRWWLFHCHTGCHIDEIIAALGLTWEELRFDD